MYKRQVLAIAFFVKLGTAYFDYRKSGQFEWTAPAILFACLVFTLTAPTYIWGIVGPVSYTHLDVYKRQAIGGINHMDFSNMEVTIDHIADAGAKIKAYATVTFEDVYKRQVYI